MATVFEKTWQCDINRAPSDGTTAAHLAQSQLWYWKAFLKGDVGGAVQGLWTVKGCSDGVNASMDGTDWWQAGAFDHTRFIRGNEGVNHSWICLQSPVGLGPYYLILDYSTTSDYTINYIWTKSLPINGTVSSRPDATDTIEAVHTANAQITENAANPHRFHGLLATDGNFIMLNSKNGATYFYQMMLFQKLAETKTEDLYPVVFYEQYSNGGVGLSTTSARWNVLRWNGTAKLSNIATAYYEWTTKPAVGDVADGTHPDSPIYVYNSSATTTDWFLKGRLIDIRMCGNDVAAGTTEPTGGPVVAMAVSDSSTTADRSVWVPSNAAPIL